jgi:hypothetical protein
MLSHPIPNDSRIVLQRAEALEWNLFGANAGAFSGDEHALTVGAGEGVLHVERARDDADQHVADWFGV